MYPLVLVCGNAGSGKDTFAKFLCAEFAKCKVYAFADPIKRQVAERFLQGDPELIKNVLWGPSHLRETPVSSLNFKENVWKVKVTTHGEVKTVRELLQAVGSWERQQYSENIWIDETLGEAEKDLKQGITDLSIVSDGRYRQEILEVKKRGGLVVKIFGRANASAAETNHSSERELYDIPSFWFDLLVPNFGTMGDLKSQAAIVSNVIRGKK